MTSQVLTPQVSPALTAWVRLLRGHSAARRTLDASLQAEHGLTVTAYEALLLLSRAEKLLRRVDLAEGLGLTASGVTRLLDGLEADGFVTKATCAVRRARDLRRPDRRAGRPGSAEASRSHVGAVRDLFEERYTPEELETLAALLRRLPGAAGADADECTA